MKLIDILARELNEWPEGAVIAVQDSDGEVKFDHSDEMPRLHRSSDVWIRQGDVGGSFYSPVVSSDYRTAIVTRRQWQAAVDALKDGIVTYSTENVSIDCCFATLTNSAANAECRIIQPEWRGEGPPPVGTVCEFMKHSSPPAPEGEWIAGDIRYISDCTVIIGGDKCEHVHHPRNCSFRPIRTPKQTGAESEINELKEMLEIFLGGFEDSVLNIQSGLIALRNAGYKKIEIVDGE